VISSVAARAGIDVLLRRRGCPKVTARVRPLRKSGKEPIGDLVPRQQAGRKYIYQQTHMVRIALDDAFRSAPPDNERWQAAAQVAASSKFMRGPTFSRMLVEQDTVTKPVLSTSTLLAIRPGGTVAALIVVLAPAVTLALPPVATAKLFCTSPFMSFWARKSTSSLPARPRSRVRCIPTQGRSLIGS
jgi:hypothetical protein